MFNKIDDLIEIKNLYVLGMDVEVRLSCYECGYTEVEDHETDNWRIVKSTEAQSNVVVCTDCFKPNTNFLGLDE